MADHQRHSMERSKRTLLDCLNFLELNLDGLRVLTEAGSQHYLLTPIIAALSGSPEVFVWINDSSYGAAKDIKSNLLKAADFFNIAHHKFTFALNERPIEHVKKSNIITNLGFVRPLDQSLLKQINPQKTVIPLMFEAWELRDSDIDISLCKKLGIKVAGTWENHPSLKIFDGCGHLAAKMAFEAGFEIIQNKILIWSSDQFGEIITKTLKSMGAKEVTLTTDLSLYKEKLSGLDFIFICDYHQGDELQGTNRLIDIDEIMRLNPGLGIVHLYGGIKAAPLLQAGINLYPPKDGLPMRMSYTLSHLGPRLVISLHAAGLKVAESMLKNLNSPLEQPVTY